MDVAAQVLVRALALLGGPLRMLLQSRFHILQRRPRGLQPGALLGLPPLLRDQARHVPPQGGVEALEGVLQEGAVLAAVAIVLLGEAGQLLLPARLQLAEGLGHLVLVPAHARPVLLGHQRESPLQRHAALAQGVEAVPELRAAGQVLIVPLCRKPELLPRPLVEGADAGLPLLAPAHLQRAHVLGDLAGGLPPLPLTERDVLAQGPQLRVDGLLLPRLAAGTSLLKRRHVPPHLCQPLLQVVELMPEVVPQVLHQLRVFLVRRVQHCGAA
mmetsp:Transcript_149139/g.460589  ORF Transcript_149139/g.460589 Transcript_149139/m.460589 type:complete len:271 (-) Transcript_149139:65-877(-)